MSAHSELIGQVADRLDNLIGALQLPLPPQIHVAQLGRALPEVRDTLRLIYIAETGEDPWATHPGSTPA
jgi:hypothetical protein